MDNLELAKEILETKKASLVVIKDGKTMQYYNHGIKDLIQILTMDKKALEEAIIADIKVGKVAGSIMVKAGVKEIYAEELSKLAIPILEQNNIKYKFNKLKDYIQNKDKTGMCPMESKFQKENDIDKIYNEYIK
jgi:hypothetical protein